jgi:hypothetical protein
VVAYNFFFRLFGFGERAQSYKLIFIHAMKISKAKYRKSLDYPANRQPDSGEAADLQAPDRKCWGFISIPMDYWGGKRLLLLVLE